MSLLLISCDNFKKQKKNSLIPFAQNEKYGYFDLTGKIIIKPQFAFASVFREDIALVKTLGYDGKWGYIDKKGKFIINAIYDNATIFNEGLAWVVSINNAPSVIDNKGKVKFTLMEAENVKLFSNGMAAFSRADSISTKWGFIDMRGKLIIDPQFREVGNFYDDICAVKNFEGKWGYINKTGKIIIKCQFDEVKRFFKGRAIITLRGKQGVINERGKLIINPKFKYIYADNDKYLIYGANGAGWCDKYGRFIINPQYEKAEIFGDNKLACIKISDKYGFIDVKGKIVISPQFDFATKFNGDLALVKIGDKYGLINESGTYVVNPQFSDVGLDFFYFLNDNYTNFSVKSDYLDTDEILKVIDIADPENFSFDDDFRKILKKANKSLNDFDEISGFNTIIENKMINKNASFRLAVIGKLIGMNPNNYEYYITKEKPKGFIYDISLSGKALNSAESIQKAFEKKIRSFKLIKKGYLDNSYTSVFRNHRNILVITNKNDLNNPMIYILNKNFGISTLLKKIVSRKVERNPYSLTVVKLPSSKTAEYYDIIGYSESIDVSSQFVDSVSVYN